MDKNILKSQEISNELLTVLKMNKGYTTESVDMLLDKVKDTLVFYENYYNKNESYLKKFKPKVTMFENYMEELKQRVQKTKVAEEKAEKEAKARYAFYEQRGKDELIKAELNAKKLIDEANKKADKIKLGAEKSSHEKIDNAKNEALTIISGAEQEKKLIIDSANNEASKINKEAIEAAEELKKLVQFETQGLLDNTANDANLIKNDALEKAKQVIETSEKIENEIKRKDEILKRILKDFSNKINYFSDSISSNFNDIKNQTQILFSDDFDLSKLLENGNENKLDKNELTNSAEVLQNSETKTETETKAETKTIDNKNLGLQNLDDMAYLKHIEDMSNNL